MVSIVLNGLITLVQVIGGIFSNSLALLSDAIHNFGDTLGLVLAYIANKVGKRKPDSKKTFGYKRFEIISAFVNAALLTGLSVYLVYEAITRLLHPEPVGSVLMLIVAVTGFLANLIAMLFLHDDSKINLNVRAAYTHLLGDTLSSVGVIAGAIIMYYSGATWIDPLITILISLVILFQAYRILRESVDILMQSTPASIALEEIRNSLEAHALVRNIHHVHCWQLQDQEILFEAHIGTCKDMLLSEAATLQAELERILEEKFNIAHVTLQIEFDACDDVAMIRQPR